MSVLKVASGLVLDKLVRTQEEVSVLSDLVNSELPSLLEDALLALEVVDTYLDAIRPVIKRIAAIPFIGSLPYVRVLVEGLYRVEEVLDNLPIVADESEDDVYI